MRTLLKEFCKWNWEFWKSKEQIPRTAKIFSSRWWDPKNLQTNDKRFYLPNGITSLHKGHSSLSKLKWYKEKKGEKKQKKILRLIKKIITNGKRSFLSNERLSLYEQILSQNFKYYFLDQDNDKKYIDRENLKTNLAQITQLHILNPE